MAPGVVACPRCHRLLHAEELTTLATLAEAHQRDGRAVEALAAWRRALELLPPQSLQSRAIGDKVILLSREVDERGLSAEPEADSRRPSWATGVGIAGTLGLLVWKFKFALVLLLTKGKLLFSGFTQVGTVLSMSATLGLYWAAWGWAFAFGIVLSIYVHEMGHIAALRRFGIRTSAPMFIPGFGAFVRLRQPLASAQEEARVGLAGPAFGLAAALACTVVWLATGSGAWGGIAQWGARLNLFNLIPMRPLDGGRGFAPLSRVQVALVSVGAALALFVTREPFLWPVLLVALFQLFSTRSGTGDRRATMEFLVLMAGLTAIAGISVRISGAP